MNRLLFLLLLTPVLANAQHLHDMIVAGTTDYSVEIKIIDSADGTPETAVEHDTPGIDLWYRREGAAISGIDEEALASLTTAHTDGGVEHISDGVYRLDLPDAAVASGADFVSFGGEVTGMIVIGGRVNLTIQTASDFVNEWESQSQADPTGFQVNVREVGGTAQTANDLGGDLQSLYENQIISTGTCDSGTTNTCVDAALTQADDYWKGMAITFPSLDEPRSCIYDFVASSDTLQFWTIRSNIDTQNYIITRDPLCITAVNESP